MCKLSVKLGGQITVSQKKKKKKEKKRKLVKTELLRQETKQAVIYLKTGSGKPAKSLSDAYDNGDVLFVFVERFVHSVWNNSFP